MMICFLGWWFSQKSVDGCCNAIIPDRSRPTLHFCLLSFSSTATNRKRLERIFGRGNSTLHTTLSIHLYFSFLYLSSLHFQFFFKARSCVPFNCMSFEFRSSEEAEIGSSYNNQTETIANKIYVKYPSISIAILVHKK